MLSTMGYEHETTTACNANQICYQGNSKQVYFKTCILEELDKHLHGALYTDRALYNELDCLSKTITEGWFLFYFYLETINI